MKKRLLAFALLCMMLSGAGAFAEAMEDRLAHFESHGRRAVFFCSGRLVKLRVAPGANKMHGCTAEGEEFRILDTFGEWVHVEITKSHADNDQSRKGMTGWIHAEHIACECDAEQTALETSEEKE